MATALCPCRGLGCGPVGFVIRFHFNMGAAMMTVDHIIFSILPAAYYPASSGRARRHWASLTDAKHPCGQTCGCVYMRVKRYILCIRVHTRNLYICASLYQRRLCCRETQNGVLEVLFFFSKFLLLPFTYIYVCIGVSCSASLGARSSDDPLRPKIRKFVARACEKLSLFETVDDRLGRSARSVCRLTGTLTFLRAPTIHRARYSSAFVSRV